MRPIAAIVVALVAVLCATLVGACEQAKPSVTPSASVAVRASEAPAASPSTGPSTSVAASSPTAEPTPTPPTPTPQPTATLAPATPTTPAATATAKPGPTGTGDGNWLVMIYQNADDEILEQDIFTDLNEAELVGSTDRVTIVAQLDRFDGAFDGDGDWTGARRYLVGQDDDLDALASEEIEDLGEVDSGDWQTLSDFATWAIGSFPADRYALILSDHGAGWVGGWNDNAPREGSAFTTDDIDRALRDALARTGVDRLDLLGFDACLMSQVEALAAVTPYARVAVASEEVEPALGWAYSAFLGELAASPDMGPDDLGRAIVESYISGDARITDDDERAQLLAEYIGEGADMSAAETAEYLGSDVTLTATNLDLLAVLADSVNDLALALAGTDQAPVAEARTYTQAFESVFDPDQPPSFLDLGNFARILAESVPDDMAIGEAARSVQEAIGSAVIAEMHGPDRPGATGFTIFFPNSVLFESTMGEGADPAYAGTARRFATASLWDDFLRFHYTGEEFSPEDADLTVLQPDGSAAQAADELSTEQPSTAAVEAPGAGEAISIAPIEASAETVDVNDTVTLTTEISGGNVAYLYLYVSWFDEQSDSFLTADWDFIGADDTLEVDGVFYPDWGTSGVGEIEVDWEPTVYFLSDGDQEEFAEFRAQAYGATTEGNEYQVRGFITFADTGNERDAVMTFTGDGQLKGAWAYANEDATGALREVTLREGDRFTIIEEWLDFDQDPDGEYVDYEGGTLTYTGRPFEMVAFEAYAGSYTLGIVVEDFDGKQSAEYVEVTVR